MVSTPTDNDRLDRPGGARGEVRVGAYCVLITVVLGLTVGVIWSAIAPRTEIVVFEGKLGVDHYSAGYIGADMTYWLLVAGAGLLAAVLMIWRWRANPLGVLVGALIGGIAGAALAVRLGTYLAGGLADAGSFDASGVSNGTVFQSPLELRSLGAMLMWPLVSALTITVFYSVAGSRLRRSLLRRYYGYVAPVNSQVHGD